jgi:hypothetical protein
MFPKDLSGNEEQNRYMALEEKGKKKVGKSNTKE